MSISDIAKVVQAISHIQRVGSQALSDVQRPFMTLLRQSQITTIMSDPAQIVQASRHTQRAGSQTLIYLQYPFIILLRQRQVATILSDQAQTVQTAGLPARQNRPLGKF